MIEVEHSQVTATPQARHNLSAPLGTHEIADLTKDLGTTTSLYLPTPSDAADAGHQMEIRWSNLRREAQAAGAPETDLDLITKLIGETDVVRPSTVAHFLGSTFIAIVSQGEVLGAGFSQRPITDGLVSVSPVPALLPTLDYQVGLIDHLVVTLDRKGADVTVVSATRTVETTVEGDDEHLHRSKAGGWSQRRFQQRAENTWESNAREVATHVADVVKEAKPALIIVAGDSRAVGFFRQHLPPTVDALVTEVRGARAEWSERDIFERATTEVDAWVAEQKVAVLRDFADSVGTGQGIEGVTDTFEVLRQGRAKRLLVADDTAEPQRNSAWTSQDPSLSFAKPTDGVESQVEAPVADIAVRTAAHMGTEIFVVPHHAASSPRDGVGAVLRS